MSVYFIRAGENGPIKIGTAKDARKRLDAMQTGSPWRLHLLAELSGDIACERELHQRYVRYRRVGEWFDPAPELLDFIATLPALNIASGRHKGTVERVIDQLGGRHVVAARYDVTYTAVGNWCAWDAFPPRLHLRIAQDCQRAGIKLAPEFFERQTKPLAQAAR
jgi:phosphoglycolate phosphatase-like HAD superfamily hydrolase